MDNLNISGLDALEKLLNDKKVVKMEELKAALKTKAAITVFRKMKKLEYISSCSHRGKYYALTTTPRFDELGLWRWGKILFSVHGTLIETSKALVEKSKAGYTAKELREILCLETKEPLLKLFRDKSIRRKKTLGGFVYFSCDPKDGKRQLLLRKDMESPSKQTVLAPLAEDGLKLFLFLFVSLLDEKLRRLFAGLESLRIGRGGDKKVAELLKMDTHTVSKGRRELSNRNFEKDRIRKKGGGRKVVQKKSLEL